MTVRSRSTQSARLVLARLHHHLGWPGVAGLIALATAAGVVVHTAALANRIDLESPLPQPVRSIGALEPSQKRPMEAAAAALLGTGDTATALKSVADAISAQSLAWLGAEYRMIPSTLEAPASLEIRTALKASYPKLLNAVAEMRRVIPGFTLRELTVSRASIDQEVLEATLVIGIILDDSQRKASAPIVGAGQ